MKKFLMIVFLLLTSVVVCQADYPVGSQLNIDGSTLGWDDTAKKWRPVAVDANGNLKTDSGESTQEISVDTSNIESYLKEVDGEETITVTDLINGIGTDTKNINSALNVDNVSVTELINGIGTDTKDIKNDLEIDNKTVTELVNGIGTDTSNIESALKTQTSENVTKTIAEMLKPIYEAYNQSPDNIPYILTSILNVNGGIATYLGTNVGQDVGAIKTETSAISKQPSEFRTARLSNLAANTVTQINVITDLNSFATHREFVELRAIDPDTEFYIGFANTLTDSNSRPVKGRILLSMPSTQSLYIYHTNASAIDIQQTEGWR